jgi:hypothetical protein
MPALWQSAECERRGIWQRIREARAWVSIQGCDPETRSIGRRFRIIAIETFQLYE